MEGFRRALREHGYVEGTNVGLEIRYAEGRTERLPELAAELVRLNVDVIAPTGDLAARVVQQATATIPIVALTDDLVAAGLVASLAHPGGNTTGVSIFSPELNAKRLELLKGAVARASRVATLWDSGTGRSQLSGMEAAARALRVRLQILEVRSPDDFERAFQMARKERAQALNVLASPFLAAYSKAIIDLAARNRLPAIYQWKEHAEAGGLMSNGPNLLEVWRQTAYLVGKVLKGAKPADLPVEQPIRFEFVLNLKTAKALGITFSPTILIRADQVIQ
jgi:putative ABC transport system substrate-binding protein